MTFGSDTRKSKHGINAMAVGEVKVFDAPTERDKRLIRKASHNQNERTNRHYMTRSSADTITVTRLR